MEAERRGLVVQETSVGESVGVRFQGRQSDARSSDSQSEAGGLAVGCRRECGLIHIEYVWGNLKSGGGWWYGFRLVGLEPGAYFI